MSGSELEQYAERGETDRRDLSRAVIHCLSLSGEWLCNIEHESEFGGVAPVNIRLTLKAHMRVTLCLASSSDDVPLWQMYLPFNEGTSVAWIYCSETFDPELILYTLHMIMTLVSAGFTTAEQLAAALRDTGAAV